MQIEQRRVTGQEVGHTAKERKPVHLKNPWVLVLLHERWNIANSFVHTIPPVGKGHVDAMCVAQRILVAALGNRAWSATVRK
jgi:hypothetical protein